MNWLVSIVLFALGVVLLFLLASGACVASVHGGGFGREAWEAALEPLWNFDAVGAGALLTAGVAVCLGVAIPVWTIADRERPEPEPTSWPVVLLVAFLVNVFVGAIVLLVLSVAWQNGAPEKVLGHLFALDVLIALVGSYLAFSLWWLEKPRMLYASTFTVHLLELGALATLFVEGARS